MTRICGNWDGATRTCAIGHPIAKIMEARGDGDNLTRWPCCGPDMLARDVKCPDKTERTPEQRAADRAKTDEDLDKFVDGLPELRKIKRKMIKNGVARGVATCVWCGEKDSLRLSVNIGGNKHMMGKCDKCGRSFME